MSENLIERFQAGNAKGCIAISRFVSPVAQKATLSIYADPEEVIGRVVKSLGKNCPSFNKLSLHSIGDFQLVTQTSIEIYLLQTNINMTNYQLISF